MVGTIATLLPDAARRFGARTALVFPDTGRTYDFAALDAMAAGLAAGLAGRGVAAGDRILLHLPNTVEWVVGYHAIARLGAVVVPINMMSTAEETIFIARDAEATLALVAADKADALTAAGIATVTCVPGQAMATDAAHRPAVAVMPDDLFSICYTSGTTGRPKGAMLTHGNVLHSVAGTAMLHGRTSDDVVVSALPFPHVYGNAVLQAALLTGMRLVAPARFDPGEALALIATHRATLFEGVPTMYYQMLAHPASAEADLTSLSRCTVGGQGMQLAKLAEAGARFGCPFLELWGMTELAGPATSHSPWWTPRPGSVGLPFPGSQLRIVDVADRSRPLPDGATGQVLIRGPLVMRGYWRQPAATADVLDADGWMATGDVGHLDTTGYLTIVDRMKDVILTGGYSVYPAEVERVLAMHPAVRMAVVVGMPDEEKGEVAHAHIVVAASADTSEAAIIAHCRLHLSAYKVPRRIVFARDLPMTSSGKLMRRMLRGHEVHQDVEGNA